jgi:hypothetical protein
VLRIDERLEEQRLERLARWEVTQSSYSLWLTTRRTEIISEWSFPAELGAEDVVRALAVGLEPEIARLTRHASSLTRKSGMKKLWLTSSVGAVSSTFTARLTGTTISVGIEFSSG